MTLPRKTAGLDYGSLYSLLESKAEHGGFGDVTWHAGPHVGDNPYGHDHDVVFVDRDKLLAAHSKPSDQADIERRSNDVGQRMDKGEVIGVPRVRIVGGRPVMELDHLAAVRAAGKRGADHVAVVVHRNDMQGLHDHVGTLKIPTRVKRLNLDKSVKWRWNGRGWYTKPSFNNGKCPQGMSAVSGKDQCAPGKAGQAAGGGAAQAPRAAAQQAQAAPPAAKSSQKAPADDAKSQSKSEPKDVGDSEPSDVTALSPDEKLSTSKIGVHTSLSKDPNSPAGNQGLDKRAFPPENVGLTPLEKAMIQGGLIDPTRIPIKKQISMLRRARLEDEWKVEAEKSMNESIDKATDHLKNVAPELDIGREYGRGVAGAAFQGPKDRNGESTVIKIDKGDNEATMAKLLMKYKDLGSLKSVPKYFRVIKTPVIDRVTDMPVNVIHREDIDDVVHFDRHGNVDLSKTTPEMHNLGNFLDMLGNDIYNVAGTYASMVRGDHPDGVHDKEDAYRKTMSMWTKIRNRKRVEAALFVPNRDHRDKINTLMNDLDKLMSHGIFPCDLHIGNWGLRKKTGDIVMRDVGCSYFHTK